VFVDKLLGRALVGAAAEPQLGGTVTPPAQDLFALEDEGDIRTLWVEYDDSNEGDRKVRYKEWRSVAKESRQHQMVENHAGSAIAMSVVRRMLRFGGNPEL
jgi:hypothetical protein